MPQCPVCKKYIKVPINREANAVVNEHIIQQCATHLLKKKRRQRPEKVCHVNGCKNQQNFDTVHCTKCRQQLCLLHRHATSHECATSGSLGAASTSRLLGEYASSISSWLMPGSSSSPSPSSSSSSPTPGASAKPKPRPKAKKKKKRVVKNSGPQGDFTLGKADRFNLRVRCPATCPFSGKKIVTTELELFFSRQWTVGRVLDDICQRAGLENRNHQPDEKKLQLTNVRTEGVYPNEIPLALLEGADLQRGQVVRVRYV